MREGWETILDFEEDLCVIGTYGSCEEAIEEKLEKAEVLVDTSENKSQTNTTETNNDDSDSPETDESGQAKLF